MVYVNKAFEKYIMSYTSLKTRSKSDDSTIKEFQMTDAEIKAKVSETKIYTVHIQYTSEKVKSSTCTCLFDMGPVCKHVVNVLNRADIEFAKTVQLDDDFEDAQIINESGKFSNEYVFENFSFSELTNTFILKNSAEFANDGKRGYFDLQPLNISINQAAFQDTYSFYKTNPIYIKLNNNTLILSCGCKTDKKKMCEHQVQLMYNLKDRKEIRVFFDEQLRNEVLKIKALDYGLENESVLENYFQLEFTGRELEITPKRKEILPINDKTKSFFKKNLLPNSTTLIPIQSALEKAKRIVVFGQHRYYDHLFIELIEVKLTKDGAIKNPLNSLNPVESILKVDEKDAVKFYSTLVKFQNTVNSSDHSTDIEALKIILKNPLNLDFYFHDSTVSDTLKASSIFPVELKLLDSEFVLNVNQKENFYEISGSVSISDKTIELKDLKLKFNYFITLGGVFYLIENQNYVRVINFFKKNHQTILIHESKFKEFQETVLSDLEHKIKINYSYLKPATKKQIKDFKFDQTKEKIIYLSDSEDYVIISPVVLYGEVEVPVLSKKQIYSTDEKGNDFVIERDDDLEVHFISILLRQHPHFEEQMDQDYFYLPKQQFLDEGWFLEVFEQWRLSDITILGFSSLKNNKLNPYKMAVSIAVSSGLDWFDTSLKIKFGNQDVSLKQLQKSVRNKTKFIELGDGTIGLLPEEWIEKFAHFFRSGEVVKETIRTHKMKFNEISELYEEEVLSQEVRDQLAYYKVKMLDFESIKNVNIPVDLKATLRDYQKQGLNWLNFLDEFNFGGCLADDMGLGKTIQIIAFILSQREKGVKNVNLIVVPTSLIVNWQKEVEKFAPSISILTIYGINRIKSTDDFEQNEIILTSYGTLLSDITFLKEYEFNYIFLDESQAIKNPVSQRYKSVRLLKSRNKIVLTGTPIENNTFDLYGQFSFACPGLLGNRQSFQDHYSAPIDKFKDTKRAIELQKKINPFLLRRTKSQVAKELPDKTEMVIYCEMEEEQRKIYDQYKQEFRNYLMASKKEKKYMDTMYILAGLTKLRQICNSPALLNDQEYYGDSSAKINVLMEEITSKSTHHKMIVFSQFVTMLDLIKIELEKRGIPFQYLTGQTKDRMSKVDDFQSNDEIRVFLISLKAGGVGLNLTEADYVYLVDPWWNPAVENQAIDRCYRIGQKKNVVAVRLICPDTIEEKIMQLQESKNELVNDLIKTDESILKSLSKDDLIEFFT